MSNYSFEQFMEEVDQELEDLCGFGHRDLCDFLYRDAYDDGCDPQDVAMEVLERNDFPMELF